MDKLNPTELFHIGEDLAAKYLTGKGYEILCKNFRSEHGEIDLIARNNAHLVFVEVKTRTKHSMKLALMNVAYSKQKKITLTAETYITQNPDCVKHSFRFDIVVVFYFEATDTFKISHLEDAFPPVDLSCL
jgi:putative endonuclease